MNNVDRSLHLGFLASHNGSGMRAIISAIQKNNLPAEANIVISNNADSGALEFARSQNIDAQHLSRRTVGSPENLDEKICQALDRHSVDLVILSGWMQMIGPKTLRKYKGKILNIHPALFTSPYKGKNYYGDKIHQAVLDAKEKVSGVTVHLVDEEYDHGDILAMIEVPVEPSDTLETLRQRVQDQEKKLYAEVVTKIIRGEITLP